MNLFFCAFNDSLFSFSKVFTVSNSVLISTSVFCWPKSSMFFFREDDLLTCKKINKKQNKTTNMKYIVVSSAYIKN